jgi:hypothetical protein
MGDISYGKKYISDGDPRAKYKQAILMSDMFLIMSRTTKRTAAPLLARMDDNNAYRISVQGNGRIEVLCFGIESIDTELEGYYDSLQDLPKWVQERIALLSMLKSEPPTEDVEGVGRRINVSTYWVYKPNK